jgi:hypothetical protein
MLGLAIHECARDEKAPDPDDVSAQITTIRWRALSRQASGPKRESITLSSTALVCASFLPEAIKAHHRAAASGFIRIILGVDD